MTDLSQLSDADLIQGYQQSIAGAGADVPAGIPRITVTPKAPSEMSNEELAAAFRKAQPVGTGEDILRSIPSGFSSGVAGSIGLPNAIADLATRGVTAAQNAAGVNIAGPEATKDVIARSLANVVPGGALWSAANAIAPNAVPSPLPTTQGARSVINQVPGADYEPQTTPGQYAHNAASFVPGALMGGPGGAVSNAIRYGVIPGLASEGAGQLTKGTALETPARIAAAIVTGGLGGAGGRSAGMAPSLEANIAARNIGVDLPRAIGSDSSLTKFVGQVANKMPGGGPMQKAVTNLQEGLGRAVGRGIGMTEGTADAMAAGSNFKTGIETSFKPALKARVGQAYDAVDNLMQPGFTRPLTETQGAVANIISRRMASGEADPGGAIKTVLGGVTRPGGLTYAGVKDLRTRVGEMLDSGVLPQGMSQAELRQVYGALSDDLKATVQAGGGQGAAAAFDKANAMAKFAADWKDNLRKALGPDTRGGEGITEALLRMASAGPTADLKALTMARGAVPKDVWQDVSATAVSRLGVDRKGQFSPAIFLNDYAKLSEPGKKILFSSVGSGDLVAHLNDIATVSKKFIEAGKLANTSGTAGHSALYTMIGGAATGALHGSLIEPVTALSVIVGNNLMARALGSPASAASVSRWTRAYDKIASNPTPGNAALYGAASTNLANTINGQFGTRFQPADLMKSIQAP